MDDYRERLVRAIKTLDCLAAYAKSNEANIRLRGKRDGLELALSYHDEVAR